MMVSKLSWKEQIACESRRQLLADSPSPSRSSDRLGIVAETLSTLARALHLLGGRESCLHGPEPLFAIAQHRGEIVQVTYQLLPWISNAISLPLRYDSLSIKCWSRWRKTPWNKYNNTTVGISTISKPYWTAFYRNKMSTINVSDLGYLFLDKSSLHIIASNLDVRDHCHDGWR